MKSPENSPKPTAKSPPPSLSPKPPVPGQSSAAVTAKSPAGAAGSNEPLAILVVDADPSTAALVRTAVSPNAASLLNQIRHATSIDAAHAEMLRRPADIALINLQIGDNAGLELIRNFKRRFPRTDLIALSRSKKSECCLDAWRAGASDLLMTPLQPAELQRGFATAQTRRAESQRALQRHLRLRNACRRLNKARHDISRQVDLLCNDLVRAYQDMAEQLNQTQTSVDCAQALAGEVDVEGVLRRTMEWVLKKLGPVNAAIYLPSGEEHFALGAYLNLDTQGDALLIETLGRTIVQQVREGTDSSPLCIDEDRTLDELFGHEAKALAGRQWLAIACRTQRECLAVLLIFRTKSGEEMPHLPAQGLLEAAAPVLADRIEQALGLYRRLHPFPEDESNDEGEPNCPS